MAELRLSEADSLDAGGALPWTPWYSSGKLVWLAAIIKRRDSMNRLYRRCGPTAMKGLILYRKFRTAGHQRSAEKAECRVLPEARR